jgi:hypothetical protein
LFGDTLLKSHFPARDLCEAFTNRRIKAERNEIRRMEITDAEIETEARRMLRETIERSGWYPSLPREFREEKIRQDVDQHWHLMIDQAKKRLEHGRVRS